MHFTQLIALLAGPAMVLATLDKCTTNTKGKYPKSPSCSAGKVSTSIQAAECAYNTRVSDQTFAVFETDHQYDDVYGAPYGTCSAYSCTAPDDSELTSGTDYWTFFWSDDGESSGTGTNCIESPDDGTCGCENSDGTFVAGSSSCT